MNDTTHVFITHGDPDHHWHTDRVVKKSNTTVFSKTLTPGNKERVGWGAIGFKINLNDKTIINLGDTLNTPDVLIIPIGGKTIHNTMDEEEALQAVKFIKPRFVIPCHSNCPGFLKKLLILPMISSLKKR